MEIRDISLHGMESICLLHRECVQRIVESLKSFRVMGLDGAAFCCQTPSVNYSSGYGTYIVVVAQHRSSIDLDLSSALRWVDISELLNRALTLAHVLVTFFPE